MQEVRELVRLIDQSKHIDEFEYEHEGAIIKIKKGNGNQSIQQEAAAPLAPIVAPQHVAIEQPVEVLSEPVAPGAPVKREENLKKIVSPMVGTFYASPSPEKPSFVSIGDHVVEETVVCIVEAMKLFNEIEAEVNGDIVEVLAKNGQLVEYGQPLFLVRER